MQVQVEMGSTTVDKQVWRYQLKGKKKLRSSWEGKARKIEEEHQEEFARELEVEQGTKVGNISQETMKHELWDREIGIGIKEKEISTIVFEQEHKEGWGQEVEIKVEEQRGGTEEPP